jgi:hypothetical protein
VLKGLYKDGPAAAANAFLVTLSVVPLSQVLKRRGSRSIYRKMLTRLNQSPDDSEEVVQIHNLTWENLKKRADWN